MRRQARRINAGVGGRSLWEGRYRRKRRCPPITSRWSTVLFALRSRRLNSARCYQIQRIIVFGHCICSHVLFFFDFFSFSASSQCIAFNTASALSGHFTALTAHSDICCMSHPMWYVSNIFDLFFSTVNCVIQHRLVAHGQLQWLIVFGIPSKLSMPVSALGQSRALRSGTFVVGMSFIYSV